MSIYLYIYLYIYITVCCISLLYFLSLYLSLSLSLVSSSLFSLHPFFSFYPSLLSISNDATFTLYSVHPFKTALIGW